MTCGSQNKTDLCGFFRVRIGLALASEVVVASIRHEYGSYSSEFWSCNMQSRVRVAYMAIVLFGVISLLGDVVYEGARGIVPDYLYFLGASAVLVGLASGLGEFLGYTVRLLSGELADRTRAYWSFIFIGYGLILTIPLLAFSQTWEIAVILVVLERLGKGFRTPSRDTVISLVSKELGAGKAFGIHELLDQVGSVLGPSLVALMLFTTNNDYQQTFIVLVIPFLMLMSFLGVTYSRVGPIRPMMSESTAETVDVPRAGQLGRSFYIYILAVLFNTAGLIPAALILFRASTVLQPLGLIWFVPVIYVIIQGVDAIIAPISGYAFDKYGVRVLMLPFVLSILPPLFLPSGAQLHELLLAPVFFGLVLGMQESTYRAAISRFAPAESRGRAYGLFNTTYGIGFLAAGLIYGTLIDMNASLLIIFIFVVVMQSLALVLLSRVHDRHSVQATDQLIA